MFCGAITDQEYILKELTSCTLVSLIYGISQIYFHILHHEIWLLM